MSEQVIKLSDNAANRIKEIMSKADNKTIGVRVGVKSGGCAGMSYMMEYAKEAKKNEENSIQILDYTKEVKSMKDSEKIQIIESLWRLIYSDKNADIYETNLMRRLEGLLYIDSKIMEDIKEKIKKENS